MAMSVIKASPQKRKHTEEYHDPDYPNEKSSQQQNNCSETIFKNAEPHIKRKKEEYNCKGNIPSDETQRLQKVCAIIEKEFQKEIHIKQQQLQDIDKRLDCAKQILERLRYSIVSTYYGKQELPLTPSDAAILRGPRTLFDREQNGPQMQLHPALKCLIGKRPRYMRPQRSAAQLAKETIRVKSDAEKKEERKRQKMIRQCGIVINHAEQNNKNANDIVESTSLSSSTITASDIACTLSNKQNIENTMPSAKVNALNTARLNNKCKHLIIVGNTSKYIGGETELDNNVPHHKAFTHKWLVYVQSKDVNDSLERYVKKVRFYLHHSYRPNDVVDIHIPPFNISRRGWGEFPIRVQLFFHSEYHQKPIQLVHNIVLDKTLSGMQTLGAETLLEIYLREIREFCQIDADNNGKNTLPQSTEVSCQNEITKKTEELLDDDINLLEFLNKIDGAPINADIEKINPTIGAIDTNILLEPKIQISPIKEKLPAITEESTPKEFIDKELSVIKTTIENPCQTVDPLTQCPSSTSTLLTSTRGNTENCLLKSPSMKEIIETPTTLSTSFKSTLMETTVKTETVTQTVTTTIPVSNIDVTSIVKQDPTITTCNATTAIKMETPPTTNSTGVISIMTNTSTTSSLQQKVCSRINSDTNTPALKRSPIFIINKNNRIVIPLNAGVSPVKTTILPIINRNNNSNIVPNVCTSGNVITNGISTPSTTTVSVCKDLKPKPIIAINGFSAKQLLQKRIVQVVDVKGQVKYVQMLINTGNSINKLKTDIATTTTTTLSNIAPRILNVTPTITTSTSIDNKTNEMINTKITPTMANENNPLTSTITLPTGRINPNIKLQQTKPNIITPSTTPPSTMSITMTTKMPPIAAKNVTSLQIDTNKGVFPDQQQQQQQLVQPENFINRSHKSKGIATTPAMPVMPLPTIETTITDDGSIVMNRVNTSVLYKEGKLCIIDPLQMKLKQQQKKQISLLKPHISLLKDQMLQKQQQKIAFLQKHHDPKLNQLATESEIINFNMVGVDRKNLEKIIFEKKFLQQDFHNMQAAVEYLLKRIPITFRNDEDTAENFLTSSSSSLSSTSSWWFKFQSLPNIQQSSLEWLRAKHVTLLLHKHKKLREINDKTTDKLWTTREVLLFARQYFYTPPTKWKKCIFTQQQTNELAAVVKRELKQQQCQTSLTYTLGEPIKLNKWLRKMSHKLMIYQNSSSHSSSNNNNNSDSDSEIVDVINPPEMNTITAMSTSAIMHYQNPQKNTLNYIRLSTPAYLENECCIVKDICRNMIELQLQPEEIDIGILYPATLTLLATCLHTFIEKLMRKTIAMKIQCCESNVFCKDEQLRNVLQIFNHDILKMLSYTKEKEFDFLSNQYFGISTATAEMIENRQKQSNLK